MTVIARALIVLVTLYACGRIMYQGDDPKVRWRIFHVVLEFCVVMVGNALVMAALLVGAAALLRVPGPTAALMGLLVTDDGRFSAGTLMTAIFLLVFATAIVQYEVRRLLRGRFGWVSMGGDEYQIFEYIIQWLTIFCVVYQCFFERFASVARLGHPEGLGQFFSIALTPANINLVLQPLLISSWVTVVLERFARRNAPKRGSARIKGRSPQNRRPGPHRGSRGRRGRADRGAARRRGRR